MCQGAAARIAQDLPTIDEEQGELSILDLPGLGAEISKVSMRSSA
jgi:hypothetical protein